MQIAEDAVLADPENEVARLKYAAALKAAGESKIASATARSADFAFVAIVNQRLFAASRAHLAINDTLIRLFEALADPAAVDVLDQAKLSQILDNLTVSIDSAEDAVKHSLAAIRRANPRWAKQD